MEFEKIHHIAVICSDRERALEFYHGKLGFEVIREVWREERQDWKIDLAMAGIELELFIMKDHPARLSPEAYGLRHLAFQVRDIGDTVKALLEKGIECEPVRTDAYTGAKMTFFRDPDGLPLEIREW